MKIFIGGCGKNGTRVPALLLLNAGLRLSSDTSTYDDNVLAAFFGSNGGHHYGQNYYFPPPKSEWLRLRNVFKSDVMSHIKQFDVFKEPRAICWAEFLKFCIPDAKFIQIVRDGRDYAHNILAGASPFNDSGRKACEHWRDVQTYGFVTLELNVEYENVHRVRLEDLVANPMEETKYIVRFGETDANPAECARIIHASDRLGDWYKWPDDQQAEATRIMKPALDLFGYG